MNKHSFSTKTTSAPPARSEPARERRRRRQLAAGLVALLLLAPGLSGGPASGQTPTATPTASPTREYRAALADGDATRAATAVSRMWRGRLTDERLRDLNRRLRVEADDRTVAAVVLEFSRLQNEAQARPGEPTTTGAAAEAPGDRFVRWLSQAVRPAPSAPAPAETGSIDGTATQREEKPRPSKRASVQARKPAAPPSNPALDYEEAMLAGDVDRMAQAAAKLTRGPLTADSLRKLNEEIGAVPEDSLVSAVLAAGRVRDEP
jgi:hypothetical protein